MGGGSWTSDSFKIYTSTKYSSLGIDVKYDADNAIINNLSNQEMFTSRRVDDALNPMNVVRECCDTEEHPNTVPVLISLDCTGSLGQCAVEIAKKLSPIMTTLYEQIQDVEFCIMGIGDLSYDEGPIQISQFESDIRIAEHLDKLWFEFGGGGNYFESYSAAWYMGSRHCRLDCWNRGQKGIIITIGDERLNPYLPRVPLNHVTGDKVQADVETKVLYNEVAQKYDVYHIQVCHDRDYDLENIRKSFEILGENYKEANLDNITNTIIDIIINATNNSQDRVSSVQPMRTDTDGISW